MEKVVRNREKILVFSSLLSVQTTEEKKEKLGQEMQQCALIKVLVTLEEMFAPFDRTKEITNN